MAGLPPHQRSSRTAARTPLGERTPRPTQNRDAPGRKRLPPAQHSRDDEALHWDDDGWNSPHEEDARHRAHRLLGHQSDGGIAGYFLKLVRLLGGESRLRRVAIALLVLFAIGSLTFAALWWRLGAGPISLDMATPWLVQAIEDNIGQGNTVEIGGTQIERAGRIRIAVRIRDVVVRDRDNAVIASAPKAEVRLSGMALLMGRLRAESLNLVDAVLAVRITPDGQVMVSTGDNARPIATGTASAKPAAGAPGQPSGAGNPASSAPAAPATPDGNAASSTVDDINNGIVAGLDWLDSLTMNGLDGQNLDEIGLKNGRLIVDDEQRGKRFNFENISLSLRRPSGGGVAFSLGEGGDHPWSLRMQVGAPANGARAIEVHANKVSIQNILLALRVKDLNYSSDLPLSGELRGELGPDGIPNYLRGKLQADKGVIIDHDTPDYPMEVDSIEADLQWDSARRVLLVPFKIISGANRITLLGHLEPPNNVVPDWQLGLSGGTIVLAGVTDEAPLIFNHIAIDIRFDTAKSRIQLTQANISNGEIGVAGTGTLDYSGEPRLMLGFAGTPMSATALKRMWPIIIVPEVREWVTERIESGSLQQIDIGVNSPLFNLSRAGPPIPDDGLSVNIVANNVALHPVDQLPSIRGADLRARVTGRTATVTVGQGQIDTPAGRRLNISEALFEVPDMAPKPSPSRVKFKLDGPVAAVAEVLASDRLSEFSNTPIDPNGSKGTVTAQVTLGMPIKRELTKADTTYAITADVSGFSADRLVMNQKLEANAMKIIANNQGYQVRGDVRINGQPASLDYRKPTVGDADIKMQATLDDASRARLGFDLGAGATGPVGVKLIGKIGGSERDSRIGIDADLTALKLDNVLPGWAKLPGRAGHATFNVVQKPQSTRLEDIVIDGGGASIKGSLEVDANGDLLSANFPVYSPSDGDKASLRAERGNDGVLKVVMRGDVFDGRSFIKSALSGQDSETRSKSKSLDFDVDLKLGAIVGYYGEAVRGVDLKMSRRNGVIRSFTLTGKLGRDTPLTAELRNRQQTRDVIFLETRDAGAFFRFTDTYARMMGGQLELAMEPPTVEPRAKEGLVNVRNFTVKGETQLDKVAGAQSGRSGVAFSRLRAEFIRKSGRLTIREGVVKGPTVGATIEGDIDYQTNQVRMSGTFVPLYGLNNMFGQIPVFGMLLGGSNEGLIGITYEVVGTPGKPDLRVNPISAMAPGVLRKIFEFNTGRQNYNPTELPPSND